MSATAIEVALAIGLILVGLVVDGNSVGDLVNVGDHVGVLVHVGDRVGELVGGWKS